MDRKLYKLPFKQNSTPDWHCPTCGKGLLSIKKETFFREESYDSREAHNHRDWDPAWITFIYSCLFQCSNNKCREIVSNTGTGYAELWYAEDNKSNIEQVCEEYFVPKYFQPYLKLISIPDDTPEEVAYSLNESFKLFFCNPPSASNHVRVSIEYLLDELNVKRYEVLNGKRRIISLHRRIGFLPTKYNDLKDLFQAIKWLGNAGSHSGQKLTSDDVMDAYEIMEHLLSEVYENKAAQVKTLAKKIIKSKGPKK